MPNLLYNLLVRDVPEAGILRAVYTVGCIELDSKVLQIPRVLWDSGAVKNSYISRRFVQRHSQYFDHLMQFQPKSHLLADSVTKVDTTHTITLPISFQAPDGSHYSASVQFVVFDMTHNDMIIGLHSFHYLSNS